MESPTIATRIQQAIDKVQAGTGQGIVFVPEGKYRITKTIYVWPAIRVIGYGAARPVFLLGKSTPGYQDPSQENYMVFFAGGRPGAGRGGPAERQPTSSRVEADAMVSISACRAMPARARSTRR